MTTLCSPISCPLKDECMRYASEEEIERSPNRWFTDHSVNIVNGKCEWFYPADGAPENKPMKGR